MLAKVKETISAYNMLSEGDSVLIGLSGGPDSVCLLYVFKRLSLQYKLKIFAAHLNHGFRGKESDSDEKFCKKLANEFNIPFFSKKVKIKKTEDAARKARYAFFEEAVGKVGANKIALGHNADDQAETVLMRLLRGAGAKGLGGIPPVRVLGEINNKKGAVPFIVRPLISCFKSEILDFLRGNKIKYRIDSSNLKTNFFRNRIRHKLLPYLKNYNPNIKEVLCNTGSNFSLVNNFLEESVENCLKKIKTTDISVSFLKRLPQVMQQEVLRKVARSFSPSLNLDAGKVSDVLGLICNPIGTKTIDLSKDIQLVREYDRLMFVRKKGMRIGYEENLAVPGEIKIQEYNIFISSALCRQGSVKRNSFEVVMDCDKILCPLVVRTRKEGDVFSPIGLHGKKKVKDIFIDAKVPERYRNILPIIISGNEICWIPGYRIGEKFKITDKTKKFIKIKVKGVENLWRTEA
jgi:tRNA(Ile)-lysidine synthase